MKKLIFLTFPLFIITIVLSITNVIVSNMLSTTGVELDKLQTDLIKYNKENIILKEKVLADTSLKNIASSAAQFGFVETKSSVYLPESVSMARGN